MTIKKIAELAGVSRGTVDRVLNNRTGVSKETRDKILLIIEKSGYKPNIVAKVLANKQYSTKKIGIILNSVDNPFYIDVIEGINEKTKDIVDFGFEVIMIHKKGYQIDEQIKAIDKMIEEKVSGLIISPINDEKVREKLNELEKLNIPVVNVNIDIEGTNRLAYIGSNYYEVGKVAASMFSMISCNKNIKLAIITGSKLVLGHNLRIKGFKDCIKENFSNIDVVEIVENEDNDDISYVETKRILENNKNIKGIFFCAAGIKGGIKAIEELGLLNKINIVTVDLTPIVRENLLKDNVIATICQEPFKQGYEALKILFDYLMLNTEPKNKIIHTDTQIKIKYNL